MTPGPDLSRRRLLALAGALGVLTAAACAVEQPAPDPGSSDSPTPEAEPRLSTTPDDPAAAAFLAGQSAAALMLLRAAVDAEPEANAVISPLSVAQALTMCAQGAAGTTLDELAGLYGATTTADLASGANAQITAIDELKNATVALANTAFLDDKLTLKDGFTTALADYFGAVPQAAPLSTDQDAAADQINSWVADHTEDKITQLITPDMLNPDSRLVLVNAVYLLARWAAQFKPEETHDGEFTTPSGPVDTPKMNDTRFLPYATAEGVQAIELGYEDESLAAYVLLPEGGTLPLYLESLDPARLWGLLDSATEQQVAISLPTFEIRQRIELSDALNAAGVQAAFEGSADFSELSDDPTYISFVIHEAWIKVAEKGTEAAAATGAGMEAGSAPMPAEPIVFDVNRPFVFLVCEKSTKTVMFACTINDPTITPS